MKSSVLKMIVAIVFIQPYIVLAEPSITNGVAARQISTNVTPAEKCTTSNPTDDEGRPVYDQAYQNCLQRNKNRAATANYINQGQSDVAAITNGGGAAGGDDKASQRQASAASQASAAQAAAAANQTAEQKRIAELDNKTAAGSQEETGNKSGKGEGLYKAAGVALAGFAAAKFGEAATCAATCSFGGCCGQVPVAMAAGAAFMLLTHKANNQADELCRAKTQACEAGNQMSAEQKTCEPCVPAGNGMAGGGAGGGAGGMPDGSGFMSEEFVGPTDMYDSNGKCLPTAPPTCVALAGVGGNAGAKIPTQCAGKTGAAKASCLASLPGAFKQNKDGTVTVKGVNGDKTYSLSDFADKKSMMALGMSAADADKLMNDLYGKNSALAKAGLDAKNLAKSSEKIFTDFSTPSSTSAGSLNQKNTNSKFNEKLAESDRRPTSEGLSRDYNGDLIGAAGDDIFSMMNRRYTLKRKQDSFIAP
jgi:hypothetical protein